MRWYSCVSHYFSVPNGVRQGSVLSPVFFAVYLDGLLQKLSQIGVGCYWGAYFVGAVCYADNIALLVPCPSALRFMLSLVRNLHFLMASSSRLRFSFCTSSSCKDRKDCKDLVALLWTSQTQSLILDMCSPKI